jgi:predicted NUDIX family NTP pyrophosphohydrolase
MFQLSAGLLLYRREPTGFEVFLVHPGGPYWSSKDDGAWSVPKGLVNPDEEELVCAHREFQEETGFIANRGNESDLGTFRVSANKRLHIWAVEGDCDPTALTSNLFEIEWPPKSGRLQHFPEIDRGAWFDKASGLLKIVRSQQPILERFYVNLTDD